MTTVALELLGAAFDALIVTSFRHEPTPLAVKVTSITIKVFGGTDPIELVNPLGVKQPPATVSVRTTLLAVASPKLP
jgi:hypothetical protein